MRTNCDRWPISQVSPYLVLPYKILVTQATRHPWNNHFPIPYIFQQCTISAFRTQVSFLKPLQEITDTMQELLSVQTSSVPSTLSADQRDGKCLVWRISKAASSECFNCYTVQVATRGISTSVTAMYHTPGLSTFIILRKILYVDKGFSPWRCLLRCYTMSTSCNIPQGLNPQ